MESANKIDYVWEQNPRGTTLNKIRALPSEALSFEALKYFENTKGRDSMGQCIMSTYSRVNLTTKQKNSLIIPQGLVLTDIFLIFQLDTLINTLPETSEIQLIAFLTDDSYHRTVSSNPIVPVSQGKYTNNYVVSRGDNMKLMKKTTGNLEVCSQTTKSVEDCVYCCFFYIIGQSRFGTSELNRTSELVELNKTTTFIPRNYTEVYNKSGFEATVNAYTNNYSPPFVSTGLSHNIKNACVFGNP